MGTRFLRVMAAAVVYGLALPASAQDLDPRAYARVPIGSTVVVTGFSFSSGDVLTDPTAAVQIDQADVSTTSLGILRSFPLFGKTAQALAALPYSWADVTGSVGDQPGRVTRSGLSDMRLRLSVLLAGAPAMRVQEFMKSPRRPIVGASLTISAPTGQYYPERLVNLGTRLLDEPLRRRVHENESPVVVEDGEPLADALERGRGRLLSSRRGRKRSEVSDLRLGSGQPRLEFLAGG